MSNATISNVRKGGFRAAKKLFGVKWPWAYVRNVRYEEFRTVFGAAYFQEIDGMPTVQLDSHNALYVLQNRLAALCNLWNIESISVVDLSDWTVREFVLDDVPAKQEG